MQISYSRVEKFKQCPYAYKLRYVDGIKSIFNCDPKNALIQGTAVHTGLEKGIEAALEQYAAAYPVLTDDIITEQIMLEIQLEKARNICLKGDFEVKITNDEFIGFIDLLTANGDGTFDIYDFKFSNNKDNYRRSAQLHVYKTMFEYICELPIRELHYLMIPKVNLKRKQNESTESYRSRVLSEARKADYEPYFMDVAFNSAKVTDWFMAAQRMMCTRKFDKKPTRLCNWCEYQAYCEKGNDYMLLPKNERREKKVITEPNMWLYGDSYVGKSTFVDQFDDVLFANTDGNTDNITSPVIPIANEVFTEGRLKKEVLAWEKFKELVEELEKKDNTFKTVALDLFEDLYEHCRVYMYKKLGIEHEQDAGFGKGWDMVKTEFFSTVKRLNHLGYRVIFISKELATEVKLKNGSGYTTYKPNIQDKVAQVITGVVGMTVRAYIDEGEHKLQLQKKENVFGGGRFEFKHPTCTLEVDAFIDELKLAQDDSVKAEGGRKSRKVADAEKQSRSRKEEKPEAQDAPEETEQADIDSSNATTSSDATASADSTGSEKPRTRTRRSRTEETVPDTVSDNVPTEATDNGAIPNEEPAPRTRVRRTRNEESSAADIQNGNIDEDAPKRERKRRERATEAESTPEVPASTEDAPRTRTRRKRGE